MILECKLFQNNTKEIGQIKKINGKYILHLALD